MPVDVYEDKLAAIRAKIAPTSLQPVERFMSSRVIDVLETSPLEDVVGKMVDGRVHRVIVTDGDQRMIGLITTIDVLKALQHS